MSIAILFNGPAGCGKDTLAKLLVAKLNNWHRQHPARRANHREFKEALFNMALTLSGLTQHEWDYLYHRERKELPTPLLGGYSPRGFLIHISETIIKPMYGTDAFGKRALKKTVDNPGQYHVFSDSGFLSEAVALTERHHVVVFRLFREGYTFDGDSRNYINPEAAGQYDIVVHDIVLQEGNPHPAIEEVMNAVCEDYRKRMALVRTAVEGALHD
ncbi:deoxynucleoside monophosphate kinase [Aeromonas phage yong1]|uniref:Deoxynucleoside monophosphate kinase n=1 Tax=Aeromonas phage yong1 TaxID=2924882 RepID=A0A9X9E7U1_9CAUD|nr:deoxynucleoside monophosphate kinase [Aeromonas phage yong1]